MKWMSGTMCPKASQPDSNGQHVGAWWVRPWTINACGSACSHVRKCKCLLHTVPCWLSTGATRTPRRLSAVLSSCQGSEEIWWLKIETLLPLNRESRDQDLQIRCSLYSRSIPVVQWSVDSHWTGYHVMVKRLLRLADRSRETENQSQ